MGSSQPEDSPSSSEANGEDALLTELRHKHQNELKSLTLATRPFKTLHLFANATLLYLKRSFLYVLRNGGWLAIIGICIAVFGSMLLAVDGPHAKRVQELLSYFRFGLWWIALGVASSIGLGSGLHTFVLYLGPHIALFTLKATQCGRVDLKTAPYDTIQLKRGPTWLSKDCSDFGPPLFPSVPNSLVRVPISSILPQVQLEAILWGVGTAIGELPPYFVSRAARTSGSKLDNVVEFESASSEDGFISSYSRKLKRWLFAHLNFGTILLLASVPNPLFDLAGIMCGQFGIPFWKFFLATLTGKAIIKTHIQTVFMILLFNNQLAQLVENELIWLLGHIPGFSSLLPNIISKLHVIKEKYQSASAPDSSKPKDTRWTPSLNLIWNTIVWLVIINFFIKIVTTTAQRHLKVEQDRELHNRLSLLELQKSLQHNHVSRCDGCEVMSSEANS